MSRTIIDPIRSLRGLVQLPGDKSISHRAIIFNGLAKGTARISGLLKSEDVDASRRCMMAMGVEIQQRGADWYVQGREGQLKSPQTTLNCGNSGTTMRLLTGVLAAQHFASTVDGDPSLRSRPMARIVDPLRQMGADIECQSSGGRAPLHIKGQELCGIEWDTPIASAQVQSALLLAGLGATGRIQITQPQGARDHTQRMFRRMGVQIQVHNVDKCSVTMEGMQALEACDVMVPGDCSSAAFFIVAALLNPGSDIHLTHLGLNPTRTGAIDALQEMGANIQIEEMEQQCGEPVGTLRIRASNLAGIQIVPSIVPRLIDELPILAIAASMASGITQVSGAAELRVKESDRIESTVAMVRALGGHAESRPDGFVIEGSGGAPLPGNGMIEANGDHRIAMAGMVGAACSLGPCVVNGSDTVAVSFPHFWSKLQELQAT